MRKLMVTILAICYGILLPAAGMPLRVCLLDAMERSVDCCDDCSDDSKDCCVDVETLPDSPMPGASFETPAFVGYAIPFVMTELPCIPVRIVPPPCFERPRTGIGPPAERLAVLNVWRL